jgi:hypothetical protein
MGEAVVIVALVLGLAWYSGKPQAWLKAYVKGIVQEVLDERSTP